MSKIFDATIGRAFNALGNAAQTVFDTISGAWDTVTGVMQSVYDKTLGKMFDAIGGALRGVFDFGKSIVGGVKDLIPGGGGGGSTTVGTAVSGGVTYNFDMTFNLSGMTDATDKRAMAREIGGLIQQEITRSTGGGRMRGRYS
jgi:phage-related protein